MIYKIEKRHEFGYGTMKTHWEVIAYTGISNIGILLNGKTLAKGTKAQCKKYCATNRLEVEVI